MTAHETPLAFKVSMRLARSVLSLQVSMAMSGFAVARTDLERIEAEVSATRHTLRIEHPAIETAEVAVPIEDGNITAIKWTPVFKSSPPRP